MCNKAACEAVNQKRKHVERIISLALSYDALRGEFSDGDGWTNKDDRLCGHLDAMRETITETAELLARAAMDYRFAIEEAAKTPPAKETIDAVESDD